ETVPLPNPLAAPMKVRARQTTPHATSDWSPIAEVRDHTKEYPAGPPRPVINPAPVFECGSRTGVSNLLAGADVWILADGVERGRVKGAKTHQGVNVNPDYTFDQRVRAQTSLCGDLSSPSVEFRSGSPPAPLPTPAISPGYEGLEQLRVTGLVNGARFDLSRSGSSLGTYRTWGDSHLVSIHPRGSPSDHFEVRQRMCPGQPASDPGTMTPRPCDELPAPRVGPVQDGDRFVIVTEKEPGSTIQVYKGSRKIGEGGGTIIGLVEPAQHQDVLYVLQSLGDCVSKTVRRVQVRCVAPPVGPDPSARNLYPVGNASYDDPAGVVIDGIPFRVSGTVYYPAQDDGPNQPFHARLAGLGRVPIVFMAHGNHATFRDPNNPLNESCGNPGGFVEIPNHEGYDYLQRALARMGIVAASVHSNQTNCKGFSATNMRQRAELILASIAHFQALDANAASVFHQKLDFRKVGLMGHSRGGEAVVVAPEIIGLAGVTVAGVLSLAPTDAGASSGAPKGHAFLTILPAGDGDVRSNDGAKYYDQARPDTFKCQVYLHRGNHNFFNRQWPQDDSKGPPPLSRSDHERVLLSYGCAFFRAALLGHDTVSYLRGTRLPAGVPTGEVHLSFEPNRNVTIDHHEDGNGIGQNSLGRPTQRSLGLTADEFRLSRTGAPQFNPTFFGATTGMVARSRQPSGEFRSELDRAVSLRRREIWVRAAEVYNRETIPPAATGFELGLEDVKGELAWVDVDDVGGLPHPFDRRADDLATFGVDFTKSMLKTVRFPGGCFSAANPRLDVDQIQAVRIRLNRGDQIPIAFDQLQIVDA
ncbi:MAG: hypothetical protein AB7I30_19620, partial [Isosphaeraceae bacterium]